MLPVSLSGIFNCVMCRCSAHLELFVAITKNEFFAEGPLDPGLVGDRLIERAREGIGARDGQALCVRGGGGWGGGGGFAEVRL